MLKVFYDRAGFSDLVWVLGPSAALAGTLGGATFELEPHHGYLSRALRYEIVPACAGVHFMIVVFLSLVLGVGPLFEGWRRRCAWLAVSAGAAYAATVLANGTRIGIAMRMHEAGATLGSLGTEATHQIEGVLVYVLFLSAMYACAAKWAERSHARAA
jgi:exosortase K